MVHKKVGTITLEYDRGDGVKVSEAFQGEFNNAIFNGDISAMEGTFQGSLTAKSINAVTNLNLKSGSVATTTVSRLSYAGRYTHGFDDDSVWRSVHRLTFLVPSSDIYGGWVSAGIQYRISDARGDNDRFPTQSRLLLDGQVIYTSPAWTSFKWYYRVIREFFHELTARIGGPGYHTIELQYRWADAPTNVYPEFFDVTIRADYFRR